MVRVSVQGSPADRESWLRLAAEVEEAGFESLWVADHPGSGPAPFVALAAAAAVTERIRLGTYVVNAGVWEPMPLASEVATLDVVSGGRAVLGVGAGHTPAEWTATGRAYPPPAERVGRMIELANATRALLTDEAVSFEGEHFTLRDAALRELRPVQERVPLLVGGNGTTVLRYAARHADIIGINGLGRTLPDGHQHEVDWTTAGLRRIVDIITTEADAAGRQPMIDALVQHVEITDDAEQAAAKLADAIGSVSAGDLLAAPFVWIGTVDEIRAELREHAATMGIDSFTVRASTIADVQRILSEPS